MAWFYEDKEVAEMSQRFSTRRDYALGYEAN